MPTNSVNVLSNDQCKFYVKAKLYDNRKLA